MASSKVDQADSFDVSGPVHMMAKNGAGSSPTVIDWDKEEHRRCVTACLVKGVYAMENDGNRRRVPNNLAPAWWKSFGFHLLEVLKDKSNDDRQFINGAIYEYVPQLGEPRCPLAPQYVVAFRGTMLLNPKMIFDCIHDLKIVFNTLRESELFSGVSMAVENLLVAAVDKSTGGCGHAAGSGSCIVWLAGHSIGASLALDVGRAMMAEKGYNLPIFLFNPPQVSLAPAIDKLLPTKKVKRSVHAANSILKAGLGQVMKPHKERMEKLFEQLSPWAPELYVHERDLICKGYINYFEQREQVKERFRGIGNSAMTLSYRDMLFAAFGKEKERPHLLPTARLWKNTSRDGHAHDLKHWWRPDCELALSAKRYSYP